MQDPEALDEADEETAELSADELPPPPRTPTGSQSDHTYIVSPASPTGSLPDHPGPPTEGYEILGEIGRGGMGVVFKARNRTLNRLVALKMLTIAESTRTEALLRFQTEAEAAARLLHPNIIALYEVGSHAGHPYLCMEYADGGTLAQHLGGKPLPSTAAAELVKTLAQAVHYAHECGIVHRDLKPANILLVSGGVVSGGVVNCQVKVPSHQSPVTPHRSPLTSHPSPLTSHLVKIADFGLAKRLDDDSQQTRSGVMMGTPSYMSPEQASGVAGNIGPGADIFALGAILYELLTGRPPFLGATALETVRQAREEDPVPPARLQPSVPRDLQTICLKCLQKEPARRYLSASALADDLGAFLAGRPIAARPVSSLERVRRWSQRNPLPASLAAALLLALLAGAGGVLWQWYRAEGEKVVAEQERDTANRMRTLAVQEGQEAIKQREDALRNLQLADNTIEGLVRLVSYLDNTQLTYLNFVAVPEEGYHRLVAHYEKFIAEHEYDPAQRAELANAHLRIALFKLRLREVPVGLQACKKAIDLLETLQAEEPQAVQIGRDLAASYSVYGFLHHAVGGGIQPEDSRLGLPFLERACDLRQRIVDAHPEEIAYRSELAGSLNDQGLVHRALSNVKDPEEKRRQLERSATSLRQACQHNEEAFRRAPHIASYRLRLANNYFNLAMTQLVQGQHAEATAAGRKMLATAPDNAAMQFRMVRILAEAAYLSAQPPKSSAAETDLPTAYLDEAISALRLAVRHGLDSEEELMKDWNVGFKLLRQRDDFKQIVKELREKPARKALEEKQP